MNIPVKEKPKDESFYLRKLAKSGGSRYLSVGKILPEDWQAVKVYVIQLKKGICVLKLEQIY